jgi:hypothetical protein
MNKLIKVIADDKSEQVIAPGVKIERRQILWLPVVATAAIVFGAGVDSTVEGSELGWEDFLKECLPSARELHQNSSRQGQEAYLRWLSYMAVRLRAAELPKAKLGKFKELEPASYFGVGYRGDPFFIVEWRMEPGAYLPPHCHPNASVCTVGLDGEARIRNFELTGEVPEFSSTKTFRVRETHNEIITAGRINALSALRDNIHTFQAGKDGAHGIDITTYHGPNVGFSHLELSGKAIDEQQRIYDAVWKKI